MDEELPQGSSWKAQRRSGIGAIALARVVGALIWFGIFLYFPPLAGAEEVEVRMLFALKCLAVATLFCLVAGVEAVAHERLQSLAFDPLSGHRTRRLDVNLRYLQNTLEQLIVLAVSLFGLAAYLDTPQSMRALLATAVVWIFGRMAFWVGYHHSAAMRGIGAPGMMATMLALLYVVWRIGVDIGGPLAGGILIAIFLGLEVLLFWNTRAGNPGD